MSDKTSISKSVEDAIYRSNKLSEIRKKILEHDIERMKLKIEEIELMKDDDIKKC